MRLARQGTTIDLKTYWGASRIATVISDARTSFLACENGPAHGVFGHSSVFVSSSSATRALTIRTHSTFRLNPDPIINGVANPLLAAKITFGRLHRYMSKEKLDLV
jgi:hypothetical protein